MPHPFAWRRLAFAEWQRLLVHMCVNPAWNDEATPAMVQLVCALLGRGSTFRKDEEVLCWDESGR